MQMPEPFMTTIDIEIIHGESSARVEAMGRCRGEEESQEQLQLEVRMPPEACPRHFHFGTLSHFIFDAL